MNFYHVIGGRRDVEDMWLSPPQISDIKMRVEPCNRSEKWDIINTRPAEFQERLACCWCLIHVTMPTALPEICACVMCTFPRGKMR